MIIQIYPQYFFPAKGRIHYNTVDQTSGLGQGVNHDYDWADNLIVDSNLDKYGNFWQGPVNTLPQGTFATAW